MLFVSTTIKHNGYVIVLFMITIYLLIMARDVSTNKNYIESIYVSRFVTGLYYRSYEGMVTLSNVGDNPIVTKNTCT